MPDSLDPRTLQQKAREMAANATNESVFASGGASARDTVGDFEVMKYPQDLPTSQHPHFVMFYITTRRGDMTQEEFKSSSAKVNFDNSQANRVPVNAAPLLTTVQGAIGGVEVGSATGERFGNFLGTARGVGAAGNLLGAIGGLLGLGTGAAVGVAKATVDNRSQVLLKKTIALYVNQIPSTSYSAQWETGDTGLMGGFLQQMAATNPNMASELQKNVKGAKSLSAIMDVVKNAAYSTGNSAKAAGAGAIDALIMQGAQQRAGGIANAAQSAAGQVVNPFKAQLFSNMNYRTFTFDYTFMPRSADEYKEVQRIINTFKIYMHPKLGVGKFVMDYPAEFTLAFYYMGELNKELFKVSNCALTNMNLQYGGQDFVTFRDIPGAPAEINMQLQFTELEMLTRERIEVGY